MIKAKFETEAEMYVVAKHRIKDADPFFSLAQVAAEQAPPGVYGRQFCPSSDQTEAVCLWKADSVEAVQDYLDQLVGGASENAYFQVGTEHAIGIRSPSERSAEEASDLAADLLRYGSRSALHGIDA